MRSVRVGRPSEIDRVATPAITAARITLGSTRVITTNQIKTPSVTINLTDLLNRLSNGDNAVKTKATFCPDTATRCARPDFLKAETICCDCFESSPITSPVNNERSSNGNDFAPLDMSLRTR